MAMSVRSVWAGQGPNRLSGQTGAISVLAASALMLSLVMLALAVDSARLFYQDSETQGAADAAAVAAVTRYTQADPGDGSRLEAARQAANAAAERSIADGLQGVELEIGRVVSEDRELSFQPDSTGVAARVSVARKTPTSLIAGWVFPDDAVLSADAVAEQPQLIELQAGSGLARLDSGDSPLLNALLGGLLGTELSLDLATYKGIADADIPLADLVDAHAGVGSVDELLDTRVGLGELIDLVVAAAPEQTSAMLQLGSIAAQVDPQLDLRLGDVLDVALPAREAAANVGLNALSLIRLAAQAANEGSAVALELGSDVLDDAGVADLDVSLALGEPPQIAIGRAGKTPQGEWRTQVSTGQLGLNVGLETGGLLSVLASVETDIGVQLAESSARAERFSFENGTPNVLVGVDPGVADLSLAVDIELASGLAGVEVEPVESEVTSSGQSAVFTPPWGPEHAQQFGAELGPAISEGLVNDLELEITLAGINLPVSVSESDLIKAITSLVGDIVGAVVEPLLESLGLQTGIADVSVNQVRAGTPRLVQ